MPIKSGESTKKKVLKNPKGGLTAAGRAHFKKTEGANLKPGVKGGCGYAGENETQRVLPEASFRQSRSGSDEG